MNTEAPVICCNDSVEHVFLGSEAGAEEKMKELRLAHYNSYDVSCAYISEVKRYPRCEVEGWSESQILERAYKNYCQRLYWRVRTIPLTIKEK